MWAAGVKASPLGQILRRSAGAEVDKAGRVLVNPDLTIPNHPEIMVIGDLANFSHQTGSPLPGVAPVAMQQGRYAAKRIGNQLRGQETAPFRYVDKGTLATIGRSAAVADFGKLRFSGWLAWVLWLSIQLVFLLQFRNRVLVILQWAWSYFTRNRSTRLIVERSESSSSNQP